MKPPSNLSYSTYATEPPVDDGVVHPTILVLLFAAVFIALTTPGPAMMKAADMAKSQVRGFIGYTEETE